MSDTEITNLLEKLSELSHHERYLLHSHTKRLKECYKIKKIVRNFIHLGKECRRHKFNHSIEVIEVAKKLKEFFNSLKEEYSNQDNYVKPVMFDISQDFKAEISLKEMEESNLKAVKDAYHSLGVESKKKLERWFSDIKREMKEEQAIESAEKHLESIITTLKTNSKTISIQVESMLKYIEEYIYLMTKSNPYNHKFINDLSITEQEIYNKSKQIYDLLRYEKENVIDPISKFAVIKYSASKRAEDIIKSKEKKGIFGIFNKKDYIEIEDIKDDLAAFTRPDEVQRYLLVLKESPGLLSNPAKRYTKSLLGLSLNKVRLLHHKSALAEIDELTKSKNRRECNIRIEHEFRKIKRYVYNLLQGKKEKEQGFSLIFFDIDNFGAFNKTYGHEVGDIVLKTIKNTIDRIIRIGPDQLYRYGGEEFCVILQDTEIQGGRAVAEKIRLNIASIKNEFVNRKTGIKDIKNITLSLGVAHSGEILRAVEGSGIDRLHNIVNISPDKFRERLLRLADQRMQYSKNSGKNRTTSKGFI